MKVSIVALGLAVRCAGELRTKLSLYSLEAGCWSGQRYLVSKSEVIVWSLLSILKAFL